MRVCEKLMCFRGGCHCQALGLCLLCVKCNCVCIYVFFVFCASIILFHSSRIDTGIFDKFTCNDT